jgi:transcriptional regulator (araC/xylS family)
VNILKQLNDAVEYIEANLCNKIDTDELARIACATPDSFIRFFSYMSGITLNVYIRRRRLTLAAYEMRNSDMKVIDVAVKYGYDSADAFAKAFSKQHGITPTQARDLHQPLRVYPPVSFHIMIKGAKEMNFRIIETEQIKLRGLSKQFTGIAANRFEQEHVMWGIEYDEYMQKINCENSGTWYGIWDSNKYWIAKAENEAATADTEQCEIPAGTYAAFSTDCGGFAGDELPKLRELIFDSWLPDSGYIQTCDYEIEVYHLYPKNEKHKRYYEIWIPVKKSFQS